MIQFKRCSGLCGTSSYLSTKQTAPIRNYQLQKLCSYGDIKAFRRRQMVPWEDYGTTNLKQAKVGGVAVIHNEEFMFSLCFTSRLSHIIDLTAQFTLFIFLPDPIFLSLPFIFIFVSDLYLTLVRATFDKRCDLHVTNKKLNLYDSQIMEMEPCLPVSHADYLKNAQLRDISLDGSFCVYINVWQIDKFLVPTLTPITVTLQPSSMFIFYQSVSWQH